MNFLAHSLLGFDRSALIAGQFCGDFVRGSDLSRFPPEIERGIRLHRHLDRFTDTHDALRPVRHQVPHVPLRFAGIVVDVMFDHYLARRWEQVSHVSLEDHVDTVHRALDMHASHFPPNLKRFVQVLKRDDILQKNIHLEAIELTLARIARRSTKFAPLALTTAQLEPLRESLVEPFTMFLPELHQSALDYLAPPLGGVS